MPSTMSDRIGAMRFEPDMDGRQKVKRIVIAVAVLVALLFLLPSTFTYIDPGHVGIVIHRAGGGVDPHPLGPGGGEDDRVPIHPESRRRAGRRV